MIIIPEKKQQNFIFRMSCVLESMHLLPFTVQYNERGKRFEGLLGIGAENLFKIDKEEMEVCDDDDCSRD